MKKLLLVTFSILSIGAAKSGNDHVPLGARAAGLSNASVCLADVWSMNNNVAGIARLEKREVAAYAENRFAMKAFTTVALVGATRLGKSGGLGLELYRFGDDLYNEQRLGIGYAHKIGQVSLGLKADVLQVHVEEYGTRRVVALSFGGQSEIVPGLIVGAHVYNLNQAKLADFEDERVPTVLTAGISYRPGKKISLNVETEKNIELPADFKAGLEYQVIEKVALRTGFSTLMETFSFGAGFTANAFQVDYAASTQSVLGFSNHLSVSYKFD